VVPGQENAGKPGYYTVRPGDSLIRIGLDVGQNWRDLARWNGLDNPNKIEVGQVLRVIAPTPGMPAPTPAAPAMAAGTAAAGTPVPAPATAGAATAPVAGAGAVVGQALPPAAATAPVPAATPAPAAPAAKAAEDNIAFIWPTEGTVIAGFDDAKNKGIDIAGKAGQPVVAAADGRVAYVGAAIRGLGNLIILKHSNTMFTAYAHNQTLLVKEDQTVKQGQKIAEMGSSDTDRIKLHFEIRRKGTPVDPVKLLPAR
jgi:lipoprotein NlpD